MSDLSDELAEIENLLHNTGADLWARKVVEAEERVRAVRLKLSKSGPTTGGEELERDYSEGICKDQTAHARCELPEGHKGPHSS